MLIYQADHSIAAYNIADIDSVEFIYSPIEEVITERKSVPYIVYPTDSIDMTCVIQQTLERFGVCMLSAGVYHISSKGIVMPEGSSLIGIGASTRLILDGYADYEKGYCVRMNSRCNVTGISFEGWTDNIQLAANVQDRHGILWSGEDGNIPERGRISNCMFSKFKGAGICCKETGTPIQMCLNVTDCYVTNCRAGIYIPARSEYHRFSNVHIQGCYYGCVNNGGNNMFSNCSFTGNRIGFVIDNTDGQQGNAAHGSVVGCTFNHSGNNTGVGIEITNIAHGYVFSGCQIFYSRTILNRAQGVVSKSCNFGRSEDISINGGGAILFNGCMYGSEPLVNIEDNEHVKFSNCYVRSSGVEINRK